MVVAEMKCVDSRETYKLKLTEVGCGLVRANKELRITIGNGMDSSDKYRSGEYGKGKYLCGEK